MARKAKAERDEVWAQSSLNKSEKRVYTDGDGDNEGGISLDGDDDKERGRDSVEESGSSPSVGGKADRTDASNISKVKDAIKNMKATNKEIIKSTSEVEEEKNFKQAKKEKEAVPTPEGGAGAGAEAPSKFSSKPNLSVILKKSLKDSLYSINVNGFYSNNGSAFAETKNSDMIPLVRNSLLLSEKIDFEKKMGSKKSISAIGNDNALTLDPTVETSDGEEIKKGDGHGEEHEAGDVESLRVAGDEISKLKSEVVGLQKQESSLLANNEYLLPPALQPDRAAQADEGGMSPPPTYRTGARALGESAAVASQAGSDFRTVEIAERSAASMFGERAELRQGLEEDSGRQVPDYAEESIERLVQKQQAEEYENEFLDPSSTSPSAAITGLPQSFAVLLPSSSFSSPSDDSYPLNPPLSLLGEWELAEQRYLTSDRYRTLQPNPVVVLHIG